MHGKARPLSAQIEARRLWTENGWSMRRIATHLELPRSTVYDWCVGLPKGEASVEDSRDVLDTACRLFDRGLSYGAITVVMGEFFGEWYCAATWAARIRRTGRRREPRGVQIHGLRIIEELPRGGRYRLRQEAYR